MKKIYCRCSKCYCQNIDLKTFPQQVQSFQPFLADIFLICPVKLRRQQLLISLLALTEQNKRLAFQKQCPLIRTLMKYFLALGIKISSYCSDFKEKYQKILQGEKQSTYLLSAYEEQVENFTSKLNIYNFTDKYNQIMKSPFKQMLQSQKMNSYIFRAQAAILIYFMKKPSQYTFNELAAGILSYQAINTLKLEFQPQNQNTLIEKLFDCTIYKSDPNKIVQIVKIMTNTLKECGVDNILTDRKGDIMHYQKLKLVKDQLKRVYKGEISRGELNVIFKQNDIN